MRRLKVYSKIIFGILILAFIANCKTTQSVKTGELERFYRQGHYKIVERKASSGIKNEKLKKKEIFYLYKAVSLAKLSQDKRYLNAHPNALKESIAAYEAYFKLIENKGNSSKNKELLSELKSVYKKSGSVAISSDAYAFLMGYETSVLVTKNEKQTPKKATPKSPKIILRGDEKDVLVKDKNLSQEDQIIAYAKKFIGVPYQYGGTGDGGFDCSGYTQYIFSRYGYKIPRSARYQKDKLKKVSLRNVQKGDLVFFSKNKRVISHVGIVISEKGEDLTMIHASSSRGIMITNVSTNTYWKPKLMGAGRVE